MEQFYDGQENRLRILAALHSKDLPVDVSPPPKFYSSLRRVFVKPKSAVALNMFG